MRHNPALVCTVSEFLRRSDSQLLKQLQVAFDTSITTEQDLAWIDELSVLRRSLPASPWASTWALLLEWMPPLLTTRIDAVLLTPGELVVIEFKQLGEQAFSAGNRRQVLSYAEDLYWFHPGAVGKAVVPVLTGTLAPLRKPVGVAAVPDEPPVAVECVSADGLGAFLSDLAARSRLSSGRRQVDGPSWVRLPYKPRPSIIDAAVALVSETEDPNIVVPLASDDELDRVVAELSSVVHGAAADRLHVVCFLSGVPGSGKTLVGLRLTHDPDIRTRLVGEGTAPLYLSGNGPLVNVLTEALARDYLIRHTTERVEQARRHAHSLIRLVHAFTKDYGSDKSRRPECSVVVFDEAQRAWDERQMVRARRITIRAW